MLPMIRSEFRKLSTIRGPWLLLAAGPVLVVAGITGLVQSGGNVHDPAIQSKALAHVGLAALFTLIFGILAVAATLVPVMTEAAPKQNPYETRLAEGSSFLSSAP